MLKLWEKYLLDIRKSGSSCGAIIEARARGIPVGLGAPIYSKLDMDIASAMMSINAVKGRHDPCVGIRAVPVGEAMMNCVLLDHYLMNKAQCS